MTVSTDDTQDPVVALMAERQRFESWLKALEDRRAETPERVFERVHADYSERLASVVRELGEHREGLERSISEHLTRGRDLEDRRMSCQDERAEAEVRAAVGEYTSERWDEVRQESDATLERLAGEQEQNATELVRLREALAATEPAEPAESAEPAEPAEVDAASTGVAARDEHAEDEQGEDQPGEAGHEEVDRAAASAGEEEEAEEPAMSSGEQHDADDAKPSQPMGGDSPHGGAFMPELKAPGHAPPPADSRFDELAFLSSVVEVPTPSPAPARRETGSVPRVDRPSAAADKPAAKAPPAAAAPPPPAAPAAQAPRPAAPRPPSDLQIEHDAPAPFELDRLPTVSPTAEATKSLRCSECGTMNYPTEWYCERCGGELAAL